MSQVAAWCILATLKFTSVINRVTYSVLNSICDFADTVLKGYLSRIDDTETGKTRQNSLSLPLRETNKSEIHADTPSERYGVEPERQGVRQKFKKKASPNSIEQNMPDIKVLNSASGVCMANSNTIVCKLNKAKTVNLSYEFKTRSYDNGSQIKNLYCKRDNAPKHSSLDKETKSNHVRGTHAILKDEQIECILGSIPKSKDSFDEKINNQILGVTSDDLDANLSFPPLVVKENLKDCLDGSLHSTEKVSSEDSVLSVNAENMKFDAKESSKNLQSESVTSAKHMAKELEKSANLPISSNQKNYSKKTLHNVSEKLNFSKQLHENTSKSSKRTYYQTISDKDTKNKLFDSHEVPVYISTQGDTFEVPHVGLTLKDTKQNAENLQEAAFCQGMLLTDYRENYAKEPEVTAANSKMEIPHDLAEKDSMEISENLYKTSHVDVTILEVAKDFTESKTDHPNQMSSLDTYCSVVAENPSEKESPTEFQCPVEGYRENSSHDGTESVTEGKHDYNESSNKSLDGNPALETLVSESLQPKVFVEKDCPNSALSDVKPMKNKNTQNLDQSSDSLEKSENMVLPNQDTKKCSFDNSLPLISGCAPVQISKDEKAIGAVVKEHPLEESIPMGDRKDKIRFSTSTCEDNAASSDGLTLLEQAARKSHSYWTVEPDDRFTENDHKLQTYMLNFTEPKHGEPACTRPHGDSELETGSESSPTKSKVKRKGKKKK